MYFCDSNLKQHKHSKRIKNNIKQHKYISCWWKYKNTKKSDLFCTTSTWVVSNFSLRGLQIDTRNQTDFWLRNQHLQIVVRDLYVCTSLWTHFNFRYCLKSGMALHIVNKVLMFCLFLASLLTLKGKKARHITGRIALNIFLPKQP